jgi:tRNA pseudouridine55 synthase
MAKKRKGRPVNGILLLDKPLNLTSNAALQIVKNLFQAQKAGHTGSLDPLATGMLPLCFGSATKLSQHLLMSDKTYYVTAKLGVTTTTGDAEGDVLETKTVDAIDTSRIEKALNQFLGKIEQIPSMYSAIKYQGRPLYELARKGITIERDPRTITIYQIELLEHHHDTFTFNVTCSNGTYVRTLVEDIGKLLG